MFYTYFNQSSLIRTYVGDMTESNVMLYNDSICDYNNATQ